MLCTAACGYAPPLPCSVEKWEIPAQIWHIIYQIGKNSFAFQVRVRGAFTMDMVAPKAHLGQGQPGPGNFKKLYEEVKRGMLLVFLSLFRYCFLDFAKFSETGKPRKETRIKEKEIQKATWKRKLVCTLKDLLDGLCQGGSGSFFCSPSQVRRPVKELSFSFSRYFFRRVRVCVRVVFHVGFRSGGRSRLSLSLPLIFAVSPGNVSGPKGVSSHATVAWL